MASDQQSGVPRGALAVVAVGLLGCLAAALLSTDEPTGAAGLSWEQTRRLPDSERVALPGGGAMRLSNAGIAISAPNIGGFSIYRIAAVLAIGEGSAVGRGRVRCTVWVSKHTIVARTPNRRASYPRPSEDLIEQAVPPKAIVEFSSHGTNLAAVELGDAFRGYTDTPGVVVEWAPFRLGRQVWEFGLPPGRPPQPLSLAFASVWRTTASPAARIACAVTTGAGSATARTAGALAVEPRPAPK